MENWKYTFPVKRLIQALKGMLVFAIASNLISCEKNTEFEPSGNKTYAAEGFQKVETEEARKITEYMRANELNGSLLISKEGRLIYKGGYGFSDVKRNMKNTESTTFPIASLTKMIVAACMLQLQEKKLLDLNDSLGKYIADFPNGERIKLTHLLSNTSGIATPLWNKRLDCPMHVINAIKERQVKFRAGARWDYQDSNYILLGHVIEKVSGVTLHEYIKKNIFSVAEMKNSGFITKRNPFPYNAQGYIKVQNHLEPRGKSNIHLLRGAGDVYSTVEDINKFDSALMSCKFFSEKSRDAMLLPRSNSHYGFGIYSFGDYFFSRGTLGGWNAVHVYFKDKTNVVLLLNARNPQLDILKQAKQIRTLINK